MKLLLMGFLLLGGAAAAQDSNTCNTLTSGPDDALIASPANHTVLFENADVRVLDVHSQPHTREAVHTHRLPSVMYILQQGAGTYDTPDGSDHRSHPTDPNFKPVFRAIKPEGPHWTENTGEVPFHAIRVEFKHPGCGLAGWKPVAPAPDDALTAAQATHTLLFENDELRVLDVHPGPGAKDWVHSHPWPGFFYVVRAGTGRQLTAGTIVAVPPEQEFRENVANWGDGAVHLVWFELKYGGPPAPPPP